MKGGRDNGYTIVEVMVFLAVSGVMFLIAAVFIAGKQASAQFTQGVNEFASRLQATIQEVADGQYNGLDTLKCTSPGAGLPPNISSAGGTGQGSNQDCVFLGKVMHLWVANDPLNYEVFSVAGLRGPIGAPITDPLSASPEALYDPSGTDGNLNKLLDSESMPQNIPLTGVKITDSSGGTPTSYAFALLTKSLDSSASTSSQSVGLYYVQNVTAASDTSATASAITAAGLKPAKQVVICVGDGQRQAAVSLGAANNQLNVAVDLSGETTCAS